MTPHPCAIDEDLSIADAVERMRANNIHHLLLLRGTELRGVVNAHDLDIALAIDPRGGASSPVERAAKQPCLCEMDTPLSTVADRMRKAHQTCAVIVDGEEAVGIFTLTDALDVLRRGSAVEHRPLTPSANDSGVRTARPQDLVRVQRILRSHGAAPGPNDGHLFR